MMDHVACWRYSESSAYPLCMSDWSVCFWKIHCLTEVVLTVGKGIFGHKMLEWLYRTQTEMQYCWHCDKWILKTQIWVWASLPSPHTGHHLGGPSSGSARTTKHQLEGSSWGLRSHLLPEEGHHQHQTISAMALPMLVLNIYWLWGCQIFLKMKHKSLELLQSYKNWQH